MLHGFDMMRILIYNFVHPSSAGHNRGGGVAVYQGNLVRALRKEGHHVISLSSGERYSVFGSAPRLVFEPGEPDQAIIVNSPVFAPAHSTFHKIDAYTDDPGLDRIPAALKARYGTIDVLHFQNVEGLSAGFFRHLREAFPDARILLSAHNYNLVCPQVNLWFREYMACTDFRDGRACANCLLSPDRHRFERNIRRMDAILDASGLSRQSPLLRPVKWLVRAPFRLRRKIASLRRRPSPDEGPSPIVVTSAEKARGYARYRQANIELSERVFDRVLAVSQRTRDVLVRHGVPASRVAVSYIGTAHHAHFRRARKVTSVGGHLHIAYLGYMRRDKGFYFFLEALEALPDSLARRLSVTVAARIWDYGALWRLEAMAHRFRDIIVHDGFTHATLDDVLRGVNLGVVPVLWEDNLPQVAIELVSRGIPTLTSDRGGAQEIAQQEAFTFPAGSHEAFARKLWEIMSGRIPLAQFWEGETRIVSMEQHLDDLMMHYAPAAAGRREMAVAAE